jgi:perosamine synthetase
MGIVAFKPTITRKELEGVLDCLLGEKLECSEVARNFEQQLCSLVNVKHALSTSSLTSAYHLAYRALEIAPGDEIVMPSCIDPAPLAAAQLAGASPVIVDTGENSLVPSAQQVKQKINESTKALVMGHLMGFHAGLDDLKDLPVPIVEDISHAIGTEHEDRPVGSSGSLSVCSFAPSMIMTTGNGGAVLTNNPRYYSTMRNLRVGGSGPQVGFDYAMTDFQAAMGLSQIAHLPDFLRRRREIARLYWDALRATPHKTLHPYSDSFAYQSFPVIFDAPSDKVDRYWKKCGIEISKPLAFPLHGCMQMKPADFPNSERLSRKLYALPLYPSLTKKEIEKIAQSLGRFI